MATRSRSISHARRTVCSVSSKARFIYAWSDSSIKVGSRVTGQRRRPSVKPGTRDHARGTKAPRREAIRLRADGGGDCARDGRGLTRPCHSSADYDTASVCSHVASATPTRSHGKTGFTPSSNRSRSRQTASRLLTSKAWPGKRSANRSGRAPYPAIVDATTDTVALEASRCT